MASSLGRYQISGELGRGTMGVVYRGYDPVLDRPVALKTVLLSDSLPAAAREQFLQRFFLEARIAGKLIHPNIVVTYDATTDQATGIPFIAMELVEGEPLSHRLAGTGKFPWKEALEIAVLLARALDYAHRAGIVHRDVKPANVLLSSEGIPKIADFGIAKLPSAHLTTTGMIMGTPYFMSPEQIEGAELDGRSDVFSLGALLYNMITGCRPFEAVDLPVILHHVLYKDPPPPSEMAPGLPVALDGVIARAMAKAPAERYASAAELASDLAAVQRGETPRSALAVGEKTQAARRSRGSPALSPGEPQKVVRAGAVHDEAGKESEKLIKSKEFVASEEFVAAPVKQRRLAPLLLLVLLAGGALLYASGLPRGTIPTEVSSYLEPLRDVLSRKLEELETLYREARSERDRAGELRGRAQTLLEEGQRLEERGQSKEALALYEQALSHYREAADGPGEASALLFRGRLRSHWADPSLARADLESAAAVYRIYGQQGGQVEALTLSGNLERDLGDFGKALSFYQRALTLSEREQSSLNKASVLSEMAFLEFMQGRWEAARERLETARQIALSEDRQEMVAGALLHLGTHSYVMGERDRAASRWKDARRAFGASSPSERLAEISLRQGRLALDAREHDSARRYFEEAERNFRTSDHLPGLAAALEDLGELERQVGREAESARKFQEAAGLRSTLGLSERSLGALDGSSLRSSARPAAGKPAKAPSQDELLRAQPLGRLVLLLGSLPRTPLQEGRLSRLRREQDRLLEQELAKQRRPDKTKRPSSLSTSRSKSSRQPKATKSPGASKPKGKKSSSKPPRRD